MKYVPPSIKYTAFNCPHCGALAAQSWFTVHADPMNNNGLPFLVDQKYIDDLDLSHIKEEWKRNDLITQLTHIATGVPSIYQEWNRREYKICNVWLSSCFNCKRVALWIRDHMIYPQGGEAPPANSDLPEDIRRDYEEASAIVNLSPRGAAALIRLTIQKLYKHLGQTGENINQDIKAMVESGLDPRVQKALDAVRVIGNNAVHPGQIDLQDDHAIAENLFRLLNLVAEKMISEPKHIDEVYSSLPEAARSAIERRDSKPSQ